jgi:hypothetical protein
MQKTAEVSMEAAQNATEASKKAVSKTNTAVKKAVEESKLKRDEKREAKMVETKRELSSEEIFDDVPAMVTLPEFEKERMAVVGEQHQNQLLMLEEIQRLSSRVDDLERRKTVSKKSDTNHSSQKTRPTGNDESSYSSQAIGEVLHILGASLMWLVALVGLDQFASEKQLMLTEAYPADLLIWSVGSFTWVMYLLFRLTKSGLRIPMLIRIQASLAVGITTLMGILMNGDSMSTVSNVWTWGTILTIAILLASSMLATAWKSTKKLVGFKQTVEIID